MLPLCLTAFGQSLSLTDSQVDLLRPESADAKQLAQVETLAVQMFASRAAAIVWLTSPNVAQEGESPHSLCSDDLGDT